MKRTLLLFSVALSAFAAHAQVSLTGTSYTQNFDGIGSGLPTGWNVYSGASATFIGNITTVNTSTTEYPSVLRPDSSCLSGVVVGGFKNFPSADVSHAGDDYCGAPPAYTNRALGVRQVSPTNATHPNLDSGAAFVLELANTSVDNNFNLAFNLQSLDSSSPRTTTWMVDYAIGSPTSFTPATVLTGTFTTGGHTFANNACTVNFGHALDNQSGNVYIRIVTLAYSSGSGNRASSAIDDVHLTWTNASSTAVANYSSQDGFSLSTIGMASTSKITLACNSNEDGDYSMSVYDLTGRIIRTEKVTVKTGVQQITVDGLQLAPGIYFVKMNNAHTSAVARVSVQ
jgi:hypothetical protein